MKRSVLFVCVHNSARSQMAEAFLRAIAGDRFDVVSAGLEPGKLNPLAVEAMREVGIDISRQPTKAVYDPSVATRRFDHVVTVCDETSAGRCPFFPGNGTREHWSFADPSALTGDDAANLAATRVIRDRIRDRVARWASTGAAV